MKIFISYRFTGEDPVVLKKLIDKVKNKIIELKHEFICSYYLDDFFKNNNFSTYEIYTYMLNKIKESDIVLFIITSDEYSKGMYLENKEAIKLKKRRILFIKKGIGNKLDLIKNIKIKYYFSDINNLINLLEESLKSTIL